MPKQPIDIALSLFTGGFNEVADPSKLAPNEAQVARDVDYDSGALKGLPGPGPSGFSDVVPESAKFLYYHDSRWISDANDRSALFDGKDLYLTQPGSYPVVYNASGNVRLGLAEVPSVSWSVATTTDGYICDWFQYAVTFCTDDGLESNPMLFDLFAGDAGDLTNAAIHRQTVTFTYPLPSDPRITKVRIYRSNGTNPIGGVCLGVKKSTVTGANYGALFFVGEQAADGSFTDSGNPNGSQPLIHGPGGFSGSSGYTEDHSPWPNIVLWSNAIHGTTQAGGASGIFVGLDEDGNVCWNLFGRPHYCPINNRFRPPGNVQAIVTHTAQTLIITDRAVYSMTGLTDETLSIGLTNANVGCLPGAGKAVVYTPYGVIFPSVRGLELFDGTNSQAFTLGKLKPSSLRGWKIRSAVYWDNRYHLFHDAGTLIVDLRTLPDAILTTSSQVVSSAITVIGSTAAPVVGVTCDPAAEPVTEATSTLGAAESYAYFQSIAGTATKVVAIGGSTTGLNFDAGYGNQCFVFDLASNTWSPAASVPVTDGSLAYKKVVALDDDRILLVSRTYVGIYTLSTNSWSTPGAYPVLPDDRTRWALATDGTKAYVWGGLLGGGMTTTTLYTLDLTNPTAWVADARATQAMWREYSAMVHHNGKLILAGGYAAFVGGGGTYFGDPTTDITTFDLTTGTYTVVGSLPRNQNIIGEAAKTAEGMYFTDYINGAGTRYFVRIGLTDYSVTETALTTEHYSLTVAGTCDVYGINANIDRFVRPGSSGGSAQPPAAPSAGMFVVTDGSTQIASWGAGPRSACSWMTGEFVSGDSAFMKRPSRLYVDISGQVAISVIRDGTEVPVYTTPPTTTRGRTLLLRLPAAASLGKRFAFKLEAAPDAEVHSVRIVGE